MVLHDKQTTSFDRAVFDYVISHFKCALPSRLRLFVEFVVLTCISYVMLAQFGSADAAYDFGVEKLLALPVAALVLFIIHGIWVWAKAPRAIYSTQHEEIQTLKQQLEEAKTLPKSSTKFDGSKSIRDQILQAAGQDYSQEWRIRTRNMLRGNLGYRYVREFNASLLDSDPEASGKSYLQGLAPRIDGNFSRAARLARQGESYHLNTACDMVWKFIEATPEHGERLNRSTIVAWRDESVAALHGLLSDAHSRAWTRATEILGQVEDTRKQPDEIRVSVDVMRNHLIMIYNKLNESMLRAAFD